MALELLSVLLTSRKPLELPGWPEEKPPEGEANTEALEPAIPETGSDVRDTDQAISLFFP